MTRIDLTVFPGHLPFGCSLGEFAIGRLAVSGVNAGVADAGAARLEARGHGRGVRMVRARPYRAARDSGSSRHGFHGHRGSNRLAITSLRLGTGRPSPRCTGSGRGLPSAGACAMMSISQTASGRHAESRGFLSASCQGPLGCLHAEAVPGPPRREGDLRTSG